MSGFFGWGKLKLAAIAEAFGDDDSLAARLEMPVLPTPVLPDVRGTPPALELDKTVTPWLRLPQIEYARALIALPAIAPREWSPKSHGAASMLGKTGETSYIELAGVNVEDTLAVVERLADVIARGSK
jgi:hypothetical protein